MRTWRVGTLSMGVTLVGLGAALLSSQLRGLSAFDTFVAWWPLLLVLLGLEVLLYLYLGGKGEQRVRYDFLSMLFVGVMFAGCLLFTLLTSVGIVGEVRSLLRQVEHTRSLPALKEAVTDEVKRVVIIAPQYPAPRVDRAQERVVQAFGTYRERAEKGGQAEAIDVSSLYDVRRAGDTLYIQIQSIPAEYGIRAFRPSMNMTLVIPSDVQAELRGPGNETIAL